MKTKIYIGLLAIALGFTSCEKALEENPAYTINNITAFETESTANMALLGCYAYLTEYNAYGQNLIETLVGPTGLTFGQNNNISYNEFVSLNVPETNSAASLSWSGLFKIISECNYYINGVEKSNLSDAYKQNAIGEARFLRALCYFNLANIFGGVPLRLEPTSTSNITMPRASRAQVYAQVEADWQYAAENMKVAKTSGRASKYVAYAYLAKLYWMLGSHDNSPSSPYWAKAKAAGDVVILNGGYDLEAKFSNLFKLHSTNSPESIFQINYSAATNGYGNRGNWVFSPTNTSNPGITWGRYRASRAYYDHFRGTYPDDPRLAATFGTTYKTIKTNNFIYHTYPYLYATATISTAKTDSIRYETLADPTNPKLTEIPAALQTAFINTNSRDFNWPYFIKQFDATASTQNSNKNLLVYRYADFLLLMADVENELNNNATAINYINRVFKRARTSATVASVYPKDIISISQIDLRERIFNERLFELAGELDMFTDVRRRGVEYFKKVLLRHDNHNITKAQVNYSKALGVTTAGFMDYLLLSGVTNEDDFIKKNLLMPIPRTELSTNEGIKQSDQNFGY